MRTSGDVMMTRGTLFPDIDPRRVQGITVPVLLFDGAKSHPFLRLITEELERLLPNHETIVFPEAGHNMWFQAPDVCRKDVEQFLSHATIDSYAWSPIVPPADHTIVESARLAAGAR
jgi:pimeloyl-ACP methyl ester carboxylesterase